MMNSEQSEIKTAPEEVPALVVHEPVSLGLVQANTPAQLVQGASAVASALAEVIEAQKLFVSISGRRYVKVEGWVTCSVMCGVTPREVSVVKAEDGAYTATVELVRMSDERVVSRASAECGADEPTWMERPNFARRSMSVTRAIPGNSRSFPY